MSTKNHWLRLTAIALAVSLLSFGLAGNASADVIPITHNFGNIDPGETSSSINKQVSVPESSPVLDFVMLVDLSGSYSNDLPNIKAVAPGLWDDLAAGIDMEAGLTTFIDFPTYPWGGPSDYPYKLNLDLTSVKADWTSAINAMVASGGSDGPESQLYALMQTANTISWRPGATRVVAITTDAPFHLDTDSGGAYPGPSMATTIAALNAQNIKVIAIKAPGASTQMDAIANGTGGAVVTSTSTSSDIADAIKTGLGLIKQDVTGQLVSCDPAIAATLNLTPGIVPDVVSGGTALFSESITVPADATPGSYDCVVEFKWGDTVVGTQTIEFTVTGGDTIAPVAYCTETTNPAGKSMPKAGKNAGKSGQNPDGFYLIGGSDDESGVASVVLIDDVSGATFGPWASDTSIKLTQAPGADPSISPGPGVIDWKIKINGNATVVVTDNAGNASSASCLVPKPPK